MKVKHFLRFKDVPPEDLRKIIKVGAKVKKEGINSVLKGKHIGLIFEKPSTRTRVSLEVAISELGGYPVVLSSKDMQMGRGESVEDTARTLSRYLDSLFIRTLNHNVLERFAEFSRIPVVNALTSRHHPLQILADCMTIMEYKGRVEGTEVCYIGDVNNVCNSWIEGAQNFGYSLRVCAPEESMPDKSEIEDLKGSGDVKFFTSAEEGARNADVLATDVWISMGMEEEKSRRLKIFKDFSITDKIVKLAKPDVIVLHCLPAYKGYEISEEVFEKFSEVLFTEAENRLHSAKAVLLWLFDGLLKVE